MTSLWPQLEPILAHVQKPARYIGCEDGAIGSGSLAGKVGWLLIYPDAYEIGLPNQGLQILYELINERPDARAERSYAPWTDMEGEMRRRGLPLFSVDSHRPAGEFDLLAFNLSAELVYTNLLNCVDLAGVPVRAADRGAEQPLVVAGGHCTFNPEPLADFVDCFVIGDGEEVVGEITDAVQAWKAGGRTPGSRQRLLRDLARVNGVYVPSCYDVVYEGPRLVAVTPRYPDVPERVEKRTIADLAAWPYPKQQLVPMTEVVHDRLNVEIFRGCTRGCRFCQAGMITRPVRERPANQVRDMVSDGLRRTGYDEVSLTSLSSADYSGIDEVVTGIIDDPACHGQVSVSLPSLRVDAFTVGIATQIQKVRRTGLTFAPEAGTWRMRRVINKLIREEDLYGAVESAFSQGWRRVKLYFLTGLPTETDEDTLGIAELARNCVGDRPAPPQGRLGHRLGGRVRPQAADAVPVVRAGHRRRAGPQNRPAPRRPPAATGASSCAGTTPGPRWPRASPVAAIAASAPSSRRCGAGAAPSRSGQSTSRSICGRKPWPPTVCPSTGTCTVTAIATRCCRGRTSRLACTRTSCGRTGRTRWRSPAHPTAGGRRVTTAGPAPDMASNTWWRRPRRRPAAVRAPARTSHAATRCRCSCGPSPPRRPRLVTRVRIRFVKLGKIRWTSHRDVARMWERAFRRVQLPVAYSAGFSPRPKVSFGLALPTGHESVAEYLDVELADQTAPSPPAIPADAALAGRAPGWPEGPAWPRRSDPAWPAVGGAAHRRRRHGRGGDRRQGPPRCRRTSRRVRGAGRPPPKKAPTRSDGRSWPTASTRWWRPPPSSSPGPGRARSTPTTSGPASVP